VNPAFFVDRALGERIFPGRLAQAGISVIRHSEQFAQDTPDEEWIPEVARNGWFALSNDRRIYRTAVQRAVVLEARLGFFVLTGGSAKAVELAENFIATYPAVLRFIERTPLPFIASVQRPSVPGRAGRVELRYPK
jgi:hypothetical protein